MKEDRLGFELADVSKIILDSLREASEKEGIVSSYRPFLFHLTHNKDGLTQSELVERIHFKAPTVSLTLQKMELDGLIRKEIDKDDQRVTRIYLTEKGKLLDDKIKKLHDDHEEYLSSLFTKEEKEEFINYLRIIKEKFKERNDE